MHPPLFLLFLQDEVRRFGRAAVRLDLQPTIEQNATSGASGTSYTHAQLMFQFTNSGVPITGATLCRNIFWKYSTIGCQQSTDGKKIGSVPEPTIKKSLATTHRRPTRLTTEPE